MSDIAKSVHESLSALGTLIAVAAFVVSGIVTLTLLGYEMFSKRKL